MIQHVLHNFHVLLIKPQSHPFSKMNLETIKITIYLLAYGFKDLWKKLWTDNFRYILKKFFQNFKEVSEKVSLTNSLLTQGSILGPPLFYTISQINFYVLKATTSQNNSLHK